MDFSALAIAVRVYRLAKKAGALDCDEQNKFPMFAWPGGYTLIYITRCGEIMCGDCVNDYSLTTANFDSSSHDRVIDLTTHDEGPSEFCCNCNREMESSYGDPDNPEDPKTDEGPEDPDINF